MISRGCGLEVAVSIVGVCLLLLQPRVQLVPAWTPAPLAFDAGASRDAHAADSRSMGAKPRRWPTAPAQAVPSALHDYDERSCAALDWQRVIGADLANAETNARANTSTRAILAAVNAQRARGAAIIMLSARNGKLFVHHRTAPWCGRWERCWFRARALLDNLQAALTAAPSDGAALSGSALGSGTAQPAPPDVDLVLCLADDCDDVAAALPVPPLVFSRTIAPRGAAAMAGAAGASPTVPAHQPDSREASGAISALRVPYDYVRVAAASCADGGVRARLRRLIRAPFRAAAALASHLALAPSAALAKAVRAGGDGDDADYEPWCGGEQEAPWEARAPVAVFRGGWANEQRESLCALAQGTAARGPGPAEAGVPEARLLDVALTARLSTSRCRLARFETLEAQAGRARMLVDVGGVTWSDRLPRELAAGATVLIVQNARGSADYLEPYLRPWRHYVPVASDLSDLPDAVRWCNANPAECAAIARRGAALSRRYAAAGAVRCYLRELVAQYAERVQRARVVDDCGPAPDRACKMHPLQPAPPHGAHAELAFSLVLDSAELRIAPVAVRVWRRRLSPHLPLAGTGYFVLLLLLLRTITRHPWRARLQLQAQLRSLYLRIHPASARLPFSSKCDR